MPRPVREAFRVRSGTRLCASIKYEFAQNDTETKNDIEKNPGKKSTFERKSKIGPGKDSQGIENRFENKKIRGEEKMTDTEIGTVVSSMNGPSPTEVDFVVTKGSVHRGQFVELDYPEGTMIALVTNVFKTNRYFERPDSVKEFESSGKKMLEQFPTTEWEYLIGQTRPLGVFDHGLVKRSTYPPDKLQSFLGFDLENGLRLGEIENHALPVRLSMSRLLKKHLAILAMSGSGKCLEGSSRVWLADGTEVPIGKLVDEQIERGFVEEGGVQIAYPSVSDQYVFSIDKNMTICKSKVLAFMRRHAPSYIVQVSFQSGRCVEATPEHLFPVWSKAGLTWTQAQNLTTETRCLGILEKKRIGGDLLVPSVSENSAFTVLKRKSEIGTFFDLVEKILWVPATAQFVYDLSTEHLNFVANKIVVHNSVCVKTIIEEVISRKPEQGRLAVIVMDPHGEYTNFAEPAPKNGVDYSSKTRVIKGRDVRLGVPHLDVGLIASMVSGLSSPQQRELKKILSSLSGEMRSGMGPFDFTAVKQSILSDKEMKSETQKILLSWIMTLEDMSLFSKTDLPSISDMTKPGQLTVVDLSDVVDMKKKQVIVGFFAKKLFFGRVKKSVPPFLLVIEEAHQFSPEKAKEEYAISKRIIETISREGRKFGASLCLVSQRPINLSTTALANCGTHVILRITNPYDLKHIGESSEGIDAQSERMITSLRVGEALIVGDAVNYPMFFKVRKNNSAPSKHETTLEEACRAFEAGQAEAESEVEAFL